MHKFSERWMENFFVRFASHVFFTLLQMIVVVGPNRPCFPSKVTVKSFRLQTPTVIIAQRNYRTNGMHIKYEHQTQFVLSSHQAELWLNTLQLCTGGYDAH